MSETPTGDGDHDVADIEFDAEGVTLRGWLNPPRSSGCSPVAVIAHGYNCLNRS